MEQSIRQDDLYNVKHIWVVWDHDGQDSIGPLFRYNKQAASMPQHAHRLPEADLAMIYWAHVFDEYPIIVLSIDTDVLPLWTWYIHQSQTRRARVYWSYASKKFVDLTSLTKCLSNGIQIYQKRFDIFDFWCCCDLLGNDYINKKTFTYGIGIKKFIPSLVCMNSDIRAAITENRKGVSLKEMRVFLKTLRSKIGGNKGTEVEQSDIDHYNAFLTYWYRDWNQIVLPQKGIASLAQSLESVCKCLPDKMSILFCDCLRGSIKGSWWMHEERCQSRQIPTCQCPSTPSAESLPKNRLKRRAEESELTDDVVRYKCVCVCMCVCVCSNFFFGY
jgi:hypothetical protein